MSELELKISELATKYLPLASEILKEAIRLPADHMDTDPFCGESNHEGPRMEYLKESIIKHGAVFKPEDVFFDEYGNIVWYVEDPEDKTPKEQKKVVYFDGHCDTVKALRSEWHNKLGKGVDCFNGVTNPDEVSIEALKETLGYVPPKEEWNNLIFGRGGADQLAGVISQIIATKIMIELRSMGALKGVIIRSYGTAAEEDNDGAGPMYVHKHVLPNAPVEMYPDAYIFTEGTGDYTRSACGIYRGQRGRMQIEVSVIGRSCHGSMPDRGLNPLEWGAKILVACTEQVENGVGIKDHDFLGRGTRTASWATLDSPSDCAVPEQFVFRFDRRITYGEDPAQCVSIIEELPVIAEARKAGLTVKVSIPRYNNASWTGYYPNNDAVYLCWETPEEHPTIQAAVKTYEKVTSKTITDEDITANPLLKREPYVGRWIFSTDGVGCYRKADECSDADTAIMKAKGWQLDAAGFWHPPMLGLGAGHEQHTHRIGEYVCTRELKAAISWMARYPSQLAEL
ncbi:Clan MH family M20 peptidase T-like metallopeptidase [Carpediemonas membranifera]|uniref:Clan MH family M20 peptidase T-like metallopeptidase n=1 Tax=Carpediemonas membranifera TaxID=201153 RepID=A0A8J6C118_9EUKA|nr:Clan MH family M20 peptidase T-like metallopeptidase [Carpediemonas membranifera]|eukprot:KAG9397131.1 Clan MH family M20 peptidase T-like metallopeptidase [Carpediemonas membranifera]